MNFNTQETRQILSAYNQLANPPTQVKVVESAEHPVVDTEKDKTPESTENIPEEITSTENVECDEGFETDTSIAIELFDFINNDHSLIDMYEKSYAPSLLRKVKRGIYKSDLAPKLFVHLATIASKKYGKELMDSEAEGLSEFTPAIRMQTAKLLTDMFERDNETVLNKMKDAATESESDKVIEQSDEEMVEPIKTPDTVFAALHKINHDILHRSEVVNGDWVPAFTDLVSSIATYVKRSEYDNKKTVFEKKIEDFKRQIKEGYYKPQEVEFLREFISRLNIALRGYTEKVGQHTETTEVDETPAVAEADSTEEDKSAAKEEKITDYEGDSTPEDLLYNFIKKNDQLSEDELEIFHKTLKQKIDRMEYDPNLAVGQFMYLVARGVNKYGEDIYDGDIPRAKEKFTTKVQQNVAKRLTDVFEEPYAKEIADIQAKKG